MNTKQIAALFAAAFVIGHVEGTIRTNRKTRKVVTQARRLLGVQAMLIDTYVNFIQEVSDPEVDAKAAIEKLKMNQDFIYIALEEI